jgi:hypothetical protein
MTPHPEPAAAYPLPRPADDHDPRFTLGLVSDIADVLAAHGYPHPDWADLMLALFRFIYQPPDQQEPNP